MGLHCDSLSRLKDIAPKVTIGVANGSLAFFNQSDVKQLTKTNNNMTLSASTENVIVGLLPTGNAAVTGSLETEVLTTKTEQANQVLSMPAKRYLCVRQAAHLDALKEFRMGKDVFSYTNSKLLQLIKDCFINIIVIMVSFLYLINNNRYLFG